MAARRVPVRAASRKVGTAFPPRGRGVRPGSQRTAEALAELFRTFADATRAGLLLELARGEGRVSDLAERVGLSPSAISHHLHSLRLTRVVRRRRVGRAVYYRLDDEHVEALLEAGLNHVRH
jgi:DNA-binding transcriptional ArsR family regulator